MFVSVEEWEETNGKGEGVGVRKRGEGKAENRALANFQGPTEKNCLNRVVQTSNTMRCFDNLLGFGISNKVFLHLLGWNVHLTIVSLLLCSYFNILDT